MQKNNWENKGFIRQVFNSGDYEKYLIIEIKGLNPFRVFDQDGIFLDRNNADKWESLLNNEIKFKLIHSNLISRVTKGKKIIFGKDRSGYPIIIRLIGKIVGEIPEKEKVVIDAGIYIYAINRDKSIKMGDYVELNIIGSIHIIFSEV